MKVEINGNVLELMMGDITKQLANCYSNSLTLAKEKELTSISFPSISTGVYRFPVELAATTALQTIKEFLSNDDFGTVKMILFSEEDYKMYTEALRSEERRVG